MLADIGTVRYGFVSRLLPSLVNNLSFRSADARTPRHHIRAGKDCLRHLRVPITQLLQPANDEEIEQLRCWSASTRLALRTSLPSKRSEPNSPPHPGRASHPCTAHHNHHQGPIRSTQHIVTFKRRRWPVQAFWKTDDQQQGRV